VGNILLSKDACGNADLKSPVAYAPSTMNVVVVGEVWPGSGLQAGKRCWLVVHALQIIRTKSAICIMSHRVVCVSRRYGSDPNQMS
jgi:hypothetical protein